MLLSSGGNCEVALQLVHLCVQFHYQPSYSFMKKRNEIKKNQGQWVIFTAINGAKTQLLARS